MIHISKIRMKNFKSFRQATIPVPNGFTAIVGPNGSGKSNIVDAICFVLGRSSAKSLRAERFSDLIFNGGKKEKPASKAEVSLYLDNSGLEMPYDSKEIKITRSIDASGNSVYRLNNKRTTRTEILEVLFSGNIQPDGHNIVLQGDVTSIIEMNPVERRGIIDEIAGIAEYDDKKRKALRELEKVSDNISTVEAVLGEVRENLEKLEGEKNDAIRHKQLKEEIKHSKGVVLTSKNLSLTREITGLDDEITGMENASQRANKHLNILQVKRDVKKKELEILNREIITKEETENFEVFREIERSKNLLASLEDKKQRAENRLEGLGDQRKKGELNISGMTQEIEDYQALNKELASHASEIEEKISKAKAMVEEKYAELSKGDDGTKGKRDRLLAARERLEDEQGELLEAEKNKTLLRERLLIKEKALENLQMELKDLKQELEAALTTKEQLSSQKKLLEIELDADYHRKKDLLREKEEAKSTLERVGVLLDHKVEELARLEAKHGAMEEAAKRLTKGNKAVEAVLKLRDEGVLKGIYGTISELGRVTPGYSKALEVAAGRGLSFLVVEDDSVAEKCIDHLKNERVGRATFLPLKKLKTASPPGEAAQLAKSAKGFALDLIKFDGKYRKAFAAVFRNTVVVEDLPFARRAMSRARMVTMEGDLIESTGLMCGGYYRSAEEGFIELDKSKERVQVLRAELDGLREERSRLIKKDARINQELQDLNTHELDTARKREALSERLKALDQSLADRREETAEKEVLFKEANSDLKELRKSIASSEKETESRSEVIREIQGEKEGLENELSLTKLEESMTEIKALEAKVMSLREERDGLSTKIQINESRIKEILGPRIKELQERVSALAEEASLLEKDLTALEEKKTEAANQLSELQERKKKVSTGIEALKAQRDGLIQGVGKIEEKIKDIRQGLEDLARGKERCRIEKAKLEARLEEVQKDLAAFNEVQIDLSEPVATEDLEKEIAKMEAELESLEPINMRAIEDYEVVKEKYEKLNSRVDVLLGEKEAILRLMEEIEHRKEAVFMEVYEGIAANFRGIFARLSPGGSADLLLEENNPLDGGLQIQARPAGKNPQYLELMSGGEKTLTALSFIFAIQRFQPAPFYVLDEIDMFLDDDNVRKVSDLVQESSRGAQFIVVSLRSSLMASADQLFGISNDDGISKIIGVELEEIAA